MNKHENNASTMNENPNNQNTEELTKPKRITITMNFTGGGKLILDTYTTLDIQRGANGLYINATNTGGDLAFNAIYDEIIKLLGKNKTFEINIKQGENTTTFRGAAADYHLNMDREILTFSQKPEEKPKDAKVE